MVTRHISTDGITRNGNQLWIYTLEKATRPPLLSAGQILALVTIRPGTLVSGGQTGVDRAALDWAIANCLDHAGWCPAGRTAADGVLDKQYQLKETESSGYRQRNKRNVQDSDATLIIYRGALEGGSQMTLGFAGKQRKPCLLLNLEIPTAQLLAQWRLWCATHKPARLNVAGPSEARCPGIYEQTMALLDVLLLPQRLLARRKQ